MTTRRDFLLATGAGLAALGTANLGCANQQDTDSSTAAAGEPSARQGGRPLVVSTWRHGVPANAAAWQILAGGGRALDAVEQGVRTAEADPEVTSVGYGGRPDRKSVV